MKLDTFEPYDIIVKGKSRCHSYKGYEDGNSYSKYGGYNGYDDETIDSAFEGMPDATWNID